MPKCYIEQKKNISFIYLNKLDSQSITGKKTKQ